MFFEVGRLDFRWSLSVGDLYLLLRGTGVLAWCRRVMLRLPDARDGANIEHCFVSSAKHRLETFCEGCYG